MSKENDEDRLKVAIQMYLDGYTVDKIYDELGISYINYNGLLTGDDRKRHTERYKKRNFIESFEREWNEARMKLLRSKSEPKLSI